MSSGNPPPNADYAGRYRAAPPIIRAALDAILDLEESLDPMGYDLDYFQEDLPKVVARAIAPWASHSGRSEP